MQEEVNEYAKKEVIESGDLVSLARILKTMRNQNRISHGYVAEVLSYAGLRQREDGVWEDEVGCEYPNLDSYDTDVEE